MHTLAVVAVSDWVALFGAIGTLVTAVAALVAAWHSRSVAASVRIPSNNVKIGSVVEGISQVQHMLVGLSHPESNIPPAVAVGRVLEQSPPTVGLRAGDTAPETTQPAPAQPNSTAPPPPS